MQSQFEIKECQMPEDFWKSDTRKLPDTSVLCVRLYLPTLSRLRRCKENSVRYIRHGYSLYSPWTQHTSLKS